MVQRGVRPASLAMASMVSTFPTSDRIDMAANTAPRITVCNIQGDPSPRFPLCRQQGQTFP